MKKPRLLLVPNPARDPDFAVTERAFRMLSDFGADVVCTEDTPSLAAVDPHFGAESADAAIVLGGDGTILRFSKIAAQADLPVLGVNLGHMGYMTEVGDVDEKILTRLIQGEYRAESRMMLHVSVWRDGAEVFASDCLNDAVVRPGELAHMLSFDLAQNGGVFASYRADGMIFATPTGSTAYSLSAGGPIVDPTLSALIATPNCAHSLSARPLVFSENAELSLILTEFRKGSAFLTADGDECFALKSGDRVEISRSRYRLNLVRFRSVPFGQTLAEKFGSGADGSV